jgi:peptide/nickel transport system substrate-binding protein/oligopeptide transport system substrate-binding protein
MPRLVRPTRSLTNIVLVLALVLTGCRWSLGTPPGVSPTVEPPAMAAGAPPTAATPVTVTVQPGGETVIEGPPPAPAPPATGEQRLTLAGSPEGPLTLDPALVRDAESAFVVRQIFRGLVRLDGSLQPVPDLAERIRISPDGLTYTFELRERARFHDGRPLTGEDIAFSLERATDPALVEGDGSKLPGWTYLRDILGSEERMAGQRDELPGVEVLDRRTIRIRLVRPAPDFLVKMAAPPAFVVDRWDVARGRDWWRRPNGSGPFRLDRWEEGRLLVLRGYRGYTPGPPVLEQIEIRLGADALDPMSQYERGLLDLVSVPLWALDRVRSPASPFSRELRVQPLYAGSFVLLNPNIPPLDDPAVRRALVQGFEREKIARVSLDGQVRVAHGLVPAGMLGREWSASLLPYDPAAARDLLKARLSGYTLRLYTAGSGVPVTLKEVYERDLGIDAEVLLMEWPDYLEDLSEQRLPIFVLSWVADYPDPATFLTSLFHSSSPDNYLGYRNPEVDRLLDLAAEEPNEDARVRLFAEAQQRILDDYVVIPLYWDIAYLLVRPRVQGLEVTPMGILGLETVWIRG